MKAKAIAAIIIFWVVKYILFYCLLSIKTGNTAIFDISALDSLEDWIYYLLIFALMPAVCTVLFTFPLFIAFQEKRLWLSAMIGMGVLVAEYFVYTCLASQTDYTNGVLNASVSVVLIIVTRILFRQVATSK